MGGICQNCNAFVACLECKIHSGEELYVTRATAHSCEPACVMLFFRAAGQYVTSSAGNFTDSHI